METTKGTSHRLAKLIAGSEIFRATVRAGLVPILGWAAVVLWSPSLGLGILLVALGLGPWRALRVVRRHEWPGAGRALPLTGKRSRSCRAALWQRLALWGCLLIVLASAALLEARQAEQAKAMTRVKVIAEVRLPHGSRFALIRDPETGHLGLYKGGESIYSAENPLPLGKIVAMHDHGLVIALPSGRMIGIPRGARLPGARGLIFV
ncbi:MAG: hypothetical protein V3W05_00975, partial [candidate division NC10 bacterium]